MSICLALEQTREQRLSFLFRNSSLAIRRGSRRLLLVWRVRLGRPAIPLCCFTTIGLCRKTLYGTFFNFIKTDYFHVVRFVEGYNCGHGQSGRARELSDRATTNVWMKE